MFVSAQPGDLGKQIGGGLQKQHPLPHSGAGALPFVGTRLRRRACAVSRILPTEMFRFRPHLRSSAMSGCLAVAIQRCADGRVGIPNG
jgi:hypothetical protein